MVESFNLQKFAGAHYYGCQGLRDLDFVLNGKHEEIEYTRLRDEEDVCLDLLHHVPFGTMFFAVFNKEIQKYTDVFSSPNDLHKWILEERDRLKNPKKRRRTGNPTYQQSKKKQETKINDMLMSLQ